MFEKKKKFALRSDFKRRSNKKKWLNNEERKEKEKNVSPLIGTIIACVFGGLLHFESEYSSLVPI